IFHFKGGRSDINKVYSFIYGEWLIQSGYIPDDKPTIEFYPPEMYLTCSNDVPEYTIALPVTIL
ncbi:MAG TPA: GyrI-like domain-containing protein, partial [Prolixibacteraceae bacterium]|nr:GyrI-like domain-containing protein [Prolixibacteraceae bacterium]